MTVAGLGYKGRAHLRDVAGRPGARVAGACDPDPEARGRASADHPGLEAFPDLESMLDALETDVLVIAAPPRGHAPAARAALERGLHVFCEKPFGLGAGDTEAMVELAAARRRALGSGLNVRTLPAVRAAKAAVTGGLIGTATSVHCSWTRNGVLPGARPYPPAWYRSRPEAGGGVIRDLGTHVLDAAMWTIDYRPGWMTGFAAFDDELTRATGAPTDPPYDVEDTARLLLTYDDGPTVSCCASWMEQADGREDFVLRVVGTTGSVTVAGTEGKANLTAELAERGDERGPRAPDLPAPTTPLNDFLDGLEAGAGGARTDLVTLAQLMDAAARSSRSRASFRYEISRRNDER